MGSVSYQRSRLVSAALFAYGAALAAPVAAYGYLGTFARHIADDYCSIHLIRGNFLANLWLNYLTISDRFSNFVLIALSEAVSPRSVSALPAILLVLWSAGLTWLLHEGSSLSGRALPLRISVLLALLLVFHVMLMAPNRYQTLYWRASSAVHLAPLVLMPFLAAWLLRGMGTAANRAIPLSVLGLTFLSSFFVGDFSEPTDALLIVLLGVSIAALWIWGQPSDRSKRIALLSSSFIGALTALLVMAVSPANALRLDSAPPALPVVLARSFGYALVFARDTVRVLPLPTLLAYLSPLVVFWTLRPAQRATEAAGLEHRTGWLLVAVPILAWVLIAASFSPSVYGQGFPVERARLAGLTSFVAAIMVMGALSGDALARWRPATARVPFPQLSAGLLLLLALYPIRAARLALGERDTFSSRAAAWDEREREIRRQKAAGQTRLIIEQFDGLEGIKELDVSADHWTNRCAASYYGVESIRALPPDGP